jgi:hypothetical protein
MTARTGAFLVVGLGPVLVACGYDRSPEPWAISDARAPLSEAQAPPPPLTPPPETASAVPPPVPSRPPAEVAPFDQGYLERHPTMCWMSSTPPDPCPIRGECKPPPIWAHVTCPPTLAKHDKAHEKPPKNLHPSPKGGYLEKVVGTNRCYHAPRRPSCSPGTMKCNLASTEVKCP